MSFLFFSDRDSSSGHDSDQSVRRLGGRGGTKLRKARSLASDGLVHIRLRGNPPKNNYKILLATLSYLDYPFYFIATPIPFLTCTVSRRGRGEGKTRRDRRAFLTCTSMLSLYGLCVKPKSRNT